MKTMNFEQMEQVNGGNICDWIFYGTGAAVGLAATIFSAGTAAIVGWGLGTYISGIGVVACHYGE